MHQTPARQSGAILLITVIFLVILLAFAALAIDIGRLYVLRTQMQNAVDSAALAAAAELDGEADARARAVKAATHLLSHQGRFSTHPELLTHLESYYATADYLANPANSPFVFYSWIGAEPDGSIPGDCVEHVDDPGKCITTEDADAAYIKIKLDPNITSGENKDYGVDFYLVPVLSMLTGDPITEGYTTAMAVAGNTDSAICNFPPIMMCAPDPGDLDIGQEVRIKSQHATQWIPGDFGFLVPFACDNNDNNCTVPQINKAMSAQMAQERTQGCNPAEVRLLPGNRDPDAYALNTRFGLYTKIVGDDFDDDKPDNDPATPEDERHTAAPNIIDYPGDPNLNADDDERYGNGLWGAADYFQKYHSDESLPSGYAGYTRFQTYYWELTGEVPDEDVYTSFWENEPLTPSGHFPLWSDGSVEQCDEDDWDKPNGYGSGRTCENIDGDPVYHSNYNTSPPTTPGITVPFPDLEEAGPPYNTGIETGLPSRRVLFVAELDCDAPDFPEKTSPHDLIDVHEHGRFVKFFLTRHVRKQDNPNTPANESSTVFAEYMGPATNREEREILIHNVIQLYE